MKKFSNGFDNATTAIFSNGSDLIFASFLFTFYKGKKLGIIKYNTICLSYKVNL